ncbi:MAG: type VI secretion system tube protein Hcp [Burkholderiales bacterium]
MATSMFIKFDGIDGESTSKDHRGEIEVLSWGWGMSASSSSTGGGAGAGKATPREFRFVHRYDKASPELLRKAARGLHIASAVLTERRAGAGQRDFLKITLKEVLVSSIESGDDGSGPTEQVALSVGDITFSVAPQTVAGAFETPVAVDWNVRTGSIA